MQAKLFARFVEFFFMENLNSIAARQWNIRSFVMFKCKNEKKITWKGAYTFKRSFLSSSIDVDISIDLRTNYNTPWKCSNILNHTCSSIFLFCGFFSQLKSMVEIFEFTLSNSIFGISVLNWIIVQTSKRMRKFDKKKLLLQLFSMQTL